jgi:hypothetical protein
LEAALGELTALQAEEKTEQEKAGVRVSLSEPEARIMKHGDQAIAPSYNAQSLMAALEEVERNLGSKPEQVVVDGGFTNRGNIVACEAQQIDLIGSLPKPEERSAAAMKSQGIDAAFAPHHFRMAEDGGSLQCPAGRQLEYVRQSVKRGDVYRQYQARGEDCRGCQNQARCCPHSGERGRTVSVRVKEQEAVAAFRQKMESEASRAIYRRRGEVAEFPNAWIKERLGVRKFRVRGMAKAASELVWACLTYNVMQWMRLVWMASVKA